MIDGKTKDTEKLAGYTVKKNQHFVSGLSSGAFMTVQLHLAHSSSFIGAGIIAGGPYRCVESFPNNRLIDTEDAYTMNALYSCMTPLIPETAPNARRLAALARQTAAAGRIDAIKNIESQRLYIFTGSRDAVGTKTFKTNRRSRKRRIQGRVIWKRHLLCIKIMARARSAVLPPLSIDPSG